jgi:streptogramin lyase
MVHRKPGGLAGRLVGFLWISAAACGGDTGGTRCTGESDCPAGLICVDGTCRTVDAGVDDGAPGDAAGCEDLDGDGRGPGCPAGDDCDDADPGHFEDCADCPTTHAPGCLCLPEESHPCYDGPPGTEGVGTCRPGIRTCVDGHLARACVGESLPADTEVCGDGVDNDCDGRGDDEVLSPCGDCDPSCRTGGDDEPEPDDPGASGLVPNPDGPGVTLGVDVLAAGFAWIANADEGTVTKLDLETGEEAARYRVGLTGTGVDSPSRTAVDGDGNAYVASRAHMSPEFDQGSVTRMAGDARFCDDRNGDGALATSAGPAPLGLGRDECVLWTVPACEPGGVPRALAVDAGDARAPQGYPWVGCYEDRTLERLEPDRGAVSARVDLDLHPYGAAVAPDGSIWTAGMRPMPGYVQRFDPRTGELDPAVSTEGSACTSETDLDRAPYGIAVDTDGRVWVTSFDRYVCRYDPGDGSWISLTMPRTVTRGIAYQSGGRIWVANYDWGGSAVVSFDAEDGSGLDVIDTAGVAPIGVGLDDLGRVWTVNQSTNNATRILPGPVIETFPVGLGPYTYSDFTGYQRRTVVPRGVWTRDHERCDEGLDDRWGELTWDADVPAGASITFAAATAATATRLASAPLVTLARVPGTSSPVNVESALGLAGIVSQRWLRVTVTLEPGPGGAAPVLRSVRVTWICPRFG